jgi:hypothetical protein
MKSRTSTFNNVRHSTNPSESSELERHVIINPIEVRDIHNIRSIIFVHRHAVKLHPLQNKDIADVCIRYFFSYVGLYFVIFYTLFACNTRSELVTGRHICLHVHLHV